MKDDIIIRSENEIDYKKTEFMTLRAFWNRYAPGCNEFLLVRKLRNADIYLPELSRIAVRNGEVVGTIMYSKATILYGDYKHEVLTFGPLCVDRKAQDCGVGGLLLEVTMDLCKKAGYDAIVIFGEPLYYPKHGFVTCDHLGLTTMDGSNFDAFMGIELHEGSLTDLEKKYGCKGKFSEGDAMDDLPQEETDAMASEFPEYLKMKLPGQWSFDNPQQEKDGYYFTEAIQYKNTFINLFNQYAEELSRYNPWLKTQVSCNGNYLEEQVESYFAKPSMKAYVIFNNEIPIGMFVVSGSKADQNHNEDYFEIEELFITKPYRHKGIAGDVIKRLLKENDLPCETYIINKNEPSINMLEKTLQQIEARFEKEMVDSMMLRYTIIK